MKKSIISPLIMIGLFIIISTLSYSQDVTVKTDTVKILTSAICEMCKERIETNLGKVKGIVSSDLEIETKIVTAIYLSEEINPDGIRKEINKIGYDADGLPASKKAYNKLPRCCQKGGHD